MVRCADCIDHGHRHLGFICLRRSSDSDEHRHIIFRRGAVGESAVPPNSRECKATIAGKFAGAGIGQRNPLWVCSARRARKPHRCWQSVQLSQRRSRPRSRHPAVALVRRASQTVERLSLRRAEAAGAATALRRLRHRTCPTRTRKTTTDASSSCPSSSSCLQYLAAG